MTTITESFNKSNSDTLGPDLTWVEDQGDIDIISNRARSGTFGGAAVARAAHSLAGNDQYAEVVVYTRTDSEVVGLGPAVRKAASSTLTFYLLWLNFPGGAGVGALTLYKVVSGAFTQLGAGGVSISYADGDTLRIECNGTTIRGLHNGTEILSRTDSGIASGAHTGIRYYNNSGLAQNCDVDSFAAGDLAAAAGSAPAVRAFPRSILNF